MIRPALSKILELAETGEYRAAPVSMEILSDIRTPLEVLRILKNISGHCYLLESLADQEQWGRYTFLGYRPKLEITCRDGQMKVGEAGATPFDRILPDWTKFTAELVAAEDAGRFLKMTAEASDGQVIPQEEAQVMAAEAADGWHFF